tara:strand:- start:8100 stop:8936 length:837 start_codon:yes stop_codon:yes gene_type:complete
MQTRQQAPSQAKEIQKKEAHLPAAINLEEASGEGLEFVSAKDLKLPILKILYANSPVLDKNDGKYIANAEKGDIYNEVTGNLWKGTDGIIVVPCLYINTFNEWKDKGDRDSPGRPINIHTDPSIMSETKRGEDNKDRLPNGNYVEDTGNHFVFILDKDYLPQEQAVIAMKSTQKKKSKTWNSMMQTRRAKGTKGFFRPPSWATTYRLTTTRESNSQNVWYGWVVEFDNFLDTTKMAKTLEITRGFYQSSMKSDIFGKVDFGVTQAQDVSQDTKATVPF